MLFELCGLTRRAGLAAILKTVKFIFSYSHWRKISAFSGHEIIFLILLICDLLNLKLNLKPDTDFAAWLKPVSGVKNRKTEARRESIWVKSPKCPARYSLKSLMKKLLLYWGKNNRFYLNAFFLQPSLQGGGALVYFVQTINAVYCN